MADNTLLLDAHLPDLELEGAAIRQRPARRDLNLAVACALRSLKARVLCFFVELANPIRSEGSDSSSGQLQSNLLETVRSSKQSPPGQRR